MEIKVEKSKNSFLQNILWALTETFGNQIFSFIVSIVLARLLLPEEFGLIGMITIFIAFGNALINSGTSNSLIRTKYLTKKDYSTIFIYNMVICFVVYIIIYFSAPFISDFYSQEQLTAIIRVYCLCFIISGFSCIQNAIFNKELAFKKLMWIRLPANIIGGVVGISLAYLQFGVWSIVYSQLVNVCLNSIMLWFFSPVKFGLFFSYPKFKRHFDYGYKITISSFVDIIYVNLYMIIIGKMYSPAQVGFYSRADNLNKLPVDNIISAVGNVTLPYLSNFQNDEIKLTKSYKNIIIVMLLILCPILCYLSAFAYPLFEVLFTKKWLEAVPYFRIINLATVLLPLHYLNLEILKVKGLPNIIVKIQFIKKIISVVLIFLVLYFGIFALLWIRVLISVMEFIVNTHYTSKYISYSSADQFKDFLSIFWISIFTFLLGSTFSYYLVPTLGNVAVLCIGFILLFGLNILLNYWFNKAKFDMIKDLVKNLRTKIN